MTKFLFDNSFELDADGKVKEDDLPEVLYTEEDIAAARGEAQQIGFAAGKAETLGDIENRAANTLGNMAEALGNIGAQHSQAILLIKQEAAQMAMVIAGKLAPALLQQQPLDEVKGLIEECLKLVPEEPRIVVRVGEMLLDRLKDDVDQLALRGGFQGTVVLLGEPNLVGADCRVEWADGGAERSVEALLQKIETAVGRYCANLNDQFNQIQEAVEAGHDVPGQNNMAADPLDMEQQSDNTVVMAPPPDDDPFPLPPGTEDFGVVEDPLPPLARAASHVPPIPEHTQDAPISVTTEP
ncbi:MAG: hypothetical protein HOK30_18945 [Rhodospirillaceae bacterium]|jgi:flagellar assembly protein FliH|nr:hypothetical protein [Rhodospirillaceae bacterium]MBT5194000.1 hypothetical protein [Rhodospirillaceae bacterium]MBT5894465.1 hypothetical protein [Rhodospirillaceae bacterium]MBT6429754.1 hypothetical protein [Rhodospirillaceae bacterium]MBT7761110.1 hypothetical protein [Rhodospirillaceae bacterium]